MNPLDPQYNLTLDEIQRYLPADLRDELPSTPKSLPPEVNSGDLLTGQHAEYCLRVIAAYCRMMSDALELYTPLPTAERFHSSPTRIRLCVGSNQAGKSITASAEYARIMRGMDPYKKLPDKNLLTMVVGKDQDHLGQVIWKKLYFPGAFEVVPDEVTGFWRSVRVDPNNPKQVDPIDMARRHLWAPAAPLIPPSSIAPGGLAYEKKNEGIPARVTMTTGSEGIFCTSKGDPRQGIQLHLAWFDEELEKRGGKSWLSETMPRLVRHNGSFMWSYTPQASVPEAYNLHRRCESGDPGVEEFTLLIDDNPYFSQEAKAALYADYAMQGDEELAVRWFAKYAIHGRMVYPTYDLAEQGVDDFIVPDNWMRVAAVDPGTSVAAAIFGAVPPEGNRLYIFHELVVKNKDAAEFAREFRRVTEGHRFEAFIIDKKGGAVHSVGRNDRVCDHYSKEFEKARVPASRLSGHGFLFGSSVPSARELSVKAMLNNKSLKFMRGRVPKLDREMKNRYYSKGNNEKREYRTVHDCADSLEYLVAFFDATGLYYHSPLPKNDVSSADSRAYEAFKAMQRAERRPSPLVHH